MLCHMSLFIFSLCRHVTFYKSLTSLSTVFIKAHVELLQLLKWLCRTSFFTHVEPYKWFRNSKYTKVTLVTLHHILDSHYYHTYGYFLFFQFLCLKPVIQLLINDSMVDSELYTKLDNCL